jgi:hypothetical protein
MSHLFFSNALQDAWLHALDTHPPLEEQSVVLTPPLTESSLELLRFRHPPSEISQTSTAQTAPESAVSFPELR